MPSSHHPSLLLWCCGCPSNVLQGHSLTVSEFPQVNVPVGMGGYNNMVLRGRHWEEKGVHAGAATSSWGSPWGFGDAFLPPWHKGLASPNRRVGHAIVPGQLIVLPEWAAVMWGWQFQPAASNWPRLPHPPERYLPLPLLGWGGDSKTIHYFQEKDDINEKKLL